jgi:hypothetical protein
MAVPLHVFLDIGSRRGPLLVFAKAAGTLPLGREAAGGPRAYGRGASRRCGFEALVDRFRARRRGPFPVMVSCNEERAPVRRFGALQRA